ncbi:NAD-dependent epimerase/dehydratase family protein [Cupriavidus sp. WKF15]|uniref:NAD-dependent epimerase/dehydratase family protein n=1 Tax=Cupriavidus sp. WKF15 TaxID=3032282 RepID=UPI0023E0F058|nr:NAD-dependent epimerase/dehydratase family protein [Cupriavidus sp. WKF15]WER49378.1 NAD-dependent epimerase/dehydratase family protein [Cupriavidus sp. WKF15]
MANGKSALVLGATGGIGSEVARQLGAAGWQVRALRRGGAPAGAQPGAIEWVSGDAMQRQDVLSAARGCGVIVHAVNPPGYRRWPELVLPMLDNTIAAARATGATIVLPGTVYNFGPDALPEPAEGAPQHPVTRKGAIRVEMERRLREAAEHGTRVIIVRAGDFFGPQAGNNWFSQALVQPGQAVRTIRYPGAAGVGHQWAYLPDVASAMVRLLEQAAMLPPFAVFHMAGHWDADGTEMVRAIQRTVARRGGQVPKVRPFPWWLLSAAAPFVATFREMQEMRYLWREPVRMRGGRLPGGEPHTPLEQAVEATLEGLGCVEAATVARCASLAR